MPSAESSNPATSVCIVEDLDQLSVQLVELLTTSDIGVRRLRTRCTGDVRR